MFGVCVYFETKKTVDERLSACVCMIVSQFYILFSNLSFRLSLSPFPVLFARGCERYGLFHVVA